MLQRRTSATPRRPASRSAAPARPRPWSGSGTSQVTDGPAAASDAAHSRPPRDPRDAIPSQPTRREGRPSSSATRWRRAARTSAAVVAMLASAQLPAATLTVRHVSARGRAGGGVDDVVHHLAVVAPAAHGGARGREAARADRDRLAGSAERSLRWSSVTRICHPPGGAAPAGGDVPADAHEHPAAALPSRRPRRRGRRPTLWRSRRGRALTPAGTRTVPLAGEELHRPPARLRAHPHARPPDGLGRRARPRPSALEQLEVAVVAGQLERPPDRGVDVAVGERRPRAGPARAPRAAAGSTRVVEPARRLSARQLGVRRGSGCRRGRSRRARAGRPLGAAPARPARTRAAPRSSRAPASGRPPGAAPGRARLGGHEHHYEPPETTGPEDSSERAARRRIPRRRGFAAGGFAASTLRRGAAAAGIRCCEASLLRGFAAGGFAAPRIRCRSLRCWRLRRSSAPLPVEASGDCSGRPARPSGRFCGSRCGGALALVELRLVLPGKALAATSASTPVSTTLPAISQRLMRLSLSRAASRWCGWCGCASVSETS